MKMRTQAVSAILSLGVLVAFTASGCGSSSGADETETGDGDGDSSALGGDGDTGNGDGDTGDGDMGNGDGDTGNGDGDTGNGDGDTGNGDGDMSFPPDVKFTYDPTKDAEPETCAATKIESEEIFLDMFIILDKSGSMTQPHGNNDSDGYCDIGDVNNGSRWCNSINGLYGFFADPTSVGMGVSYTEFSDGSCDAFSMDVGFDILQANDANGHLSDIEDEMNDDDPANGTNTEGAVDTLIAETGSHTPTGTRKTIAILVTDGAPSSTCRDGDDVDTHLAELNGLLVDHYTNNGIPTFIIGMDGVDADNLETLAAGAGAVEHANDCISGDALCSYYSVGDGNPQVFIDALEQIRGAVLGCEYAVPQADVGLSNLDTLEVKFTPDTGVPEVTLDQVATEGGCSSASQYWVDLSGGADPVIKLCPATCDTRGSGAAIDISLKCEGS